MSVFLIILARDLRLARQDGWQFATGILFFLLVVMLIAFGIGPDPKLLQAVAPGAIWVAALLACLLSLHRVFDDDREDGSLDRLMASPVPLESVALAKMASHWLISGAPLVLISPLTGLLLHVPAHAMPAIALSLLAGTPVLSLTGGAISAIMLGARGGMLTALLILPLYIPVLIFGAAAAGRAITGDDPASPLLLITAMLAIALPLAPVGAAAALAE